MESITYYMFIVIMFFSGCSLITGISYEGPTLRLTKKVSLEKIAVIGFSTEGNTLPRGIEEFATQRLTDLLYIKGQYNVIDYLKTKDVRQSLSLKLSDKLTPEQLTNLNLELDASYVIVGSLIQYSSSAIIEPGTKQKLSLGIRIIDAKTYDVIGVINSSCEFKRNMKERVEELIIKSIDSLIAAR